MSYPAPDFLPVAEIPAGTSLLLSGPPLTRKRELMFRLLEGQTDREGTVMVTTRWGAGSLLAQYRDLVGEQNSDTLKVVDCVSKQRGMGDVQETEITSYLSSPQDMTGLGIKLLGLFQEFHDADIQTRFGLYSLSTFLMYHDLKRVYRMVHVLAGRIEAANWLGVFVVDSPTDREFSILSQLIDGVIQTRETEDGNQYRLRGLGVGKTAWQDY